LRWTAVSSVAAFVDVEAFLSVSKRAGWTSAFETSFRIDASRCGITRRINSALIDVDASAVDHFKARFAVKNLISSLFEAVRILAAISLFALFLRRAVITVALMAGETVALISALVIRTVSETAALVRVEHTLVLVDAVEPVAGEALVTEALVAALRVQAATVLVTTVNVLGAFVDVNAVEAVSRVARLALALVTSAEVNHQIFKSGSSIAETDPSCRELPAAFYQFHLKISFWGPKRSHITPDALARC
jgi:hypothetical protein